MITIVVRQYKKGSSIHTLIDPISNKNGKYVSKQKALRMLKDAVKTMQTIAKDEQKPKRKSDKRNT